MDLNSIFQNIDFSKLLEKWNQKDSNVDPVPAPALNPDTTAAAAPVTQPKSNQELLDQINSMREQRAQLDKIDAARPQPTEFKKKWNDYVGMGLAGLGQAVALRGGGKVMGPSAMDILKNAKEDNAAQNAKLLADWQAKRQAVVDKMSNIKTTAEMVGKGLTDQARIAKDAAATNLATAQADQVGKLTPYQKQQLDIEQNRLNEANRHNTTMEGISRDKVNSANGGTSAVPGEDNVPVNKVTESLAKNILTPANRTKIINDEARINRQIELYPKVAADVTGLKKIATAISETIGRDPGAPFDEAMTKLAIDQMVLSPEQKEFMWNETKKAYSELKDTVGSTNISNQDVAGLMSQRQSFLNSPEMFANDMKSQQERLRNNKMEFNRYARTYSPQSLLGETQVQQPTTPKQTVKVGDVISGYRFKGGDTKDKANWEKVQ